MVPPMCLMMTPRGIKEMKGTNQTEITKIFKDKIREMIIDHSPIVLIGTLPLVKEAMPQIIRDNPLIGAMSTLVKESKEDKNTMHLHPTTYQWFMKINQTTF